MCLLDCPGATVCYLSASCLSHASCPSCLPCFIALLFCLVSLDLANCLYPNCQVSESAFVHLLLTQMPWNVYICGVPLLCEIKISSREWWPWNVNKFILVSVIKTASWPGQWSPEDRHISVFYFYFFTKMSTAIICSQDIAVGIP